MAKHKAKPKKAEEAPPVHPVDAVMQVHQELAKVADWCHSVKTIHNVNTEEITKSFQKCDSLLKGLFEYERSLLPKEKTIPAGNKISPPELKPETSKE